MTSTAKHVNNIKMWPEKLKAPSCHPITVEGEPTCRFRGVGMAIGFTRNFLVRDSLWLDEETKIIRKDELPNLLDIFNKFSR